MDTRTDNKKKKLSCRLCGSGKLNILIDLGNLPIAHRYVTNCNEPENTFPYMVHTCLTCGFHQILRPISADLLYRNYNYCFTSWKPEPHRDNQIKLIRDLTNGTNVFEIGCNDGTFLDALKEKGFVNCVGVEPNVLSGKMARDKGHTVYEDLLSREICSKAVEAFGKFDCVVSRHVIEHITDLEQFFSCVDMLLKPGGLLMLDAPDCGAAFKMGDASVLWEEHVNYFSEATMQAMLHGIGYEVVALKRYLFTGESLSIISRRRENRQPGIFSYDSSATNRSESIGDFGAKVRRFAAQLKHVLAARKQAGETVALYGVGARGVMTVNALELGKLIDIAFDDQPEKQGKYMPGSRVAIRDPRTAREYPGPLTCLLAVNNENEEAVKNRMVAMSGQNVTFASLFSPKDIWRELESLRI